MNTPRIRALVRAERVKRAHGPTSPLWRRCRDFRTRLIAQMTEDEWQAAADAVVADQKARP